MINRILKAIRKHPFVLALAFVAGAIIAASDATEALHRLWERCCKQSERPPALEPLEALIADLEHRSDNMLTIVNMANRKDYDPPSYLLNLVITKMPELSVFMKRDDIRTATTEVERSAIEIYIELSKEISKAIIDKMEYNESISAGEYLLLYSNVCFLRDSLIVIEARLAKEASEKCLVALFNRVQTKWFISESTPWGHDPQQIDVFWERPHSVSILSKESSCHELAVEMRLTETDDDHVAKCQIASDAFD